ncbi:hypothetical protein QEG73_22300 [Chitinophagaceae bacterium 26-R-25]|nr:hypothetical protein [Chitinophagaceae bacterium 26-R-25]
MVGVFKQNNLGNAFFLLLYALVIKFPMFIHGQYAVQLEGDNYIYHLVLKFLNPLTSPAPVLFPIIAFIFLFAQSTLINRLCNNLKLFPRPNYLVGMSYLLITSLVKEWSYFSAPLLINFLLIWIWYLTNTWYNSNQPKTNIFNTSILVGILPLIYSPSIAFILVLVLALLITRPFRLTEWFIAILGLITPYYFLFVILYLVNKWQWQKLISPIHFYLPKLTTSLWITGGIVLLVLPFLIGAFYVQNNLNKMLIQVRKTWSLLLVLLVVSLMIILINPGTGYQHWLMITIPLATFHAAVYYFSNSKFFALILHWFIFGFVILLQYNGLFS